MKYPKISMVIGSYNRLPLLKLCIDAVRKELQNENYEIIVVDGGSTDGGVEWLVEQKDIISIIQHNRGDWLGKKIERKPWAYFMNLAFKCASGKYLCMLSDDSLIVPGAILNGTDLFDEMLAQEVKLGAVAFYFRDYPVRKDYAVAINVGNLYLNHGLYLREALQDVGFIDESFHFYFADTDLVLRMKQKGYKCISSKTSFVEHYFEATPEIRASNTDDKKEGDRLKLIDRWKGIAYPEEKYDDYKKIVGYWEHHPRGFTDPNKTIDKLIKASIAPKKVSVVTIIYSGASDFRKTVKSVANLNFDSFEYIVIDGLSTLNTIKFLKQYDNHIDKVVSAPGTGLYDGMNKALDHCSGEYVIFMNAGNVFHDKNTLNCIFESEDIKEVDVIYGDWICFSDGSQQFQTSLPIEQIWKKIPYKYQAAFVSLDKLKEAPFDLSYRSATDYDQIVRLYKLGAKFKHLSITVTDLGERVSPESDIMLYLEILKIQSANAPKGFAKESSYVEYFSDNAEKLIEGLKSEI